MAVSQEQQHQIGVAGKLHRFILETLRVVEHIAAWGVAGMNNC